MAHSDRASISVDQYPPRPYYRNVSADSTTSSTAYNGSEGYIDDQEYPSVDLDRDGYESIGAHSASGRAGTARPALGSRLLSSIQNSQPAAAALTRSKSIFHSRAKSLASFVSKPSTPTSEQLPQQPHRLFGDLFNGESAPVRLGIPPSSPTKEKEEMEFLMDYKPALTERPQRSIRRASTTPATPPQQTTTKTGWFGRKITTPKAPAPAVAKDELVNLDIWTTLFPNGPIEELTPHAFNDLLLNASTLLDRMQNAYREKVEYIASIQPEMDIQKEEAEEADTRAAHLKMQLEDMGRKAQEQEAAMKDLADQLAEERLRAQEAKENTIRPVRSIDQKDEDTTPRRRKRGSAGSASDSGFESDIDRESVFSSTGANTPLSPPPPTVTLTPSFDSMRDRSKQVRAVPSYSSSGSTVVNRSGSGAWATVEQLRGENQVLRKEMGEMERRLQDVIEFVGQVQL